MITATARNDTASLNQQGLPREYAEYGHRDTPCGFRDENFRSFTPYDREESEARYPELRAYRLAHADEIVCSQCGYSELPWGESCVLCRGEKRTSQKLLDRYSEATQWARDEQAARVAAIAAEREAQQQRDQQNIGADDEHDLRRDYRARPGESTLAARYRSEGFDPAMHKVG